NHIYGLVERLGIGEHLITHVNGRPYFAEDEEMDGELYRTRLKPDMPWDEDEQDHRGLETRFMELIRLLESNQSESNPRRHKRSEVKKQEKLAGLEEVHARLCEEKWWEA